MTHGVVASPPAKRGPFPAVHQSRDVPVDTGLRTIMRMPQAGVPTCSISGNLFRVHDEVKRISSVVYGPDDNDAKTLAASLRLLPAAAFTSPTPA